MAGVLIQDGRRPGHLGWATAAISGGVADGAVISAFHTPRIASPRNPAAAAVAEAVRTCGGEVLFDASTHARLLAGANDLVHYDTWSLWSGTVPDLTSHGAQLDHVERVLDRQAELGVPALSPTITLDSPTGGDARRALRLAGLGQQLHRGCSVSVAGRRGFWRSGAQLDAYVGQLAALRAPMFVVTLANDLVADLAPPIDDPEAFVGLARSVHSLSLRSRVIVAQSDYSGLLGVAAGADTVGSGWDRGQKTFDPSSFQVSSGGVRIAASYVTQAELGATLRRVLADAIDRLDNVYAAQVRGGLMPPDDAGQRHHHLHCLRDLVLRVAAQGANRPHRVAELRAHYERAQQHFDRLQADLPGGLVPASARAAWADLPLRVLEEYARSEGL